MVGHPQCVLVDDDPDFVTFVRVCLWRICPEMEITAFFSGFEAVGYLAGRHADLLITDFKMPVLDGLELTRRARASDEHLPIVVMSGDAIETEALASGASEFVPKYDLATRLASAMARFGFGTADAFRLQPNHSVNLPKR